MLARGLGRTKKTGDCDLAFNTGLNVDRVCANSSIQSLPNIDARFPNLVNEFLVQVFACVGLFSVTSIRAKERVYSHCSAGSGLGHNGNRLQTTPKIHTSSFSKGV